jgi:tetratricopeptide (TPR) repeat protein
MGRTKFFAELKRRSVYRAAVLYGMGAWLLAQIATQIFPFFNVPNSAVRFVIVALALCFPIAMVLAWLYELTPEGFVRTEDVDLAKQRGFGRKIDFVIIGVLLLVIVMLVYQRLPFRAESGEAIPEKSIAVLPFANFSDDKENAFFADGIQDDILTSLPMNADRHANLGWFYAFAGRNDEAIREGRRAVELKPESKDAFDGAIMNCYLALIYARVGETDLALPLIERLLKTPGAVDSVDYSITVNDLKFRWEWDPIRKDPRFQKLISGNKP